MYETIANDLYEECNKTHSLLNNEKSGRRVYKQIYRKDWETNPIFKGWLSPVSCDKYKAECTACKKELLAHRLTLLKHASSAKHFKKVAMAKDSKSLKKFDQKENVVENQQSVISANDENTNQSTVNIPPQLVSFSNTNVIISNESLNNIDQELAKEMEAQLSQFTAGEVTTNSSKLEHNNSSLVFNQITSIIIKSESFVDLSDSPEAINFEQCYFARSRTDNANALYCPTVFLNEKINESGSGIINKITTYPLQISTRVTD